MNEDSALFKNCVWTFGQFSLESADHGHVPDEQLLWIALDVRGELPALGPVLLAAVARRPCRVAARAVHRVTVHPAPIGAAARSQRLLKDRLFDDERCWASHDRMKLIVAQAVLADDESPLHHAHHRLADRKQPAESDASVS